MAGHSDDTFRKFYDQLAIRTTQISVMALQENMDTISHVEALGLDDNDISKDRFKRMNELRANAKKEKEERIRLKTEARNPIPDKDARRVIDILLEFDFKCFDNVEHLSRTIGAETIVNGLIENDEVGLLISDVFNQNKEKIVNYVVSRCALKLKRGKALSSKDKRAGYQLFCWILGSMDGLLQICDPDFVETNCEYLKMFSLKRAIASDKVLFSKRDCLSVEDFLNSCQEKGFRNDVLLKIVESTPFADPEHWFLAIDKKVNKVVFNPLNIFCHD